MSSRPNPEELSPETRLTRVGRDPDAQHGFINPPVYHGSTVLFPDVATLKSRNQRYTYGLRGTPTTDSLEAALNDLEGSEGTTLVPSGLAAITLAFLALVEAGDHVLVVDSAYFPTRHFCDTMLRRLGVEVEYYAPTLDAAAADRIRPETRLMLLEAPGSHSFEMQDVPALAAACRAHGVLTAIDNTWASPLYFKPLAHGVDISIQAGTKYVAGHSDLLTGSVSANGEVFKRLRAARDSLGFGVGPDDVALTLRGLRTMAVRLERHQASALKVARWLRERPEVARVLHPALPEDPGHALWKRDFTGSSGLFGVVLNPVSEASVAAFLDNLRLFGLGFSWGGFESLAIPCWPATYRTAAPWQAEGPLVRLNIGLEDPDDLIADLAQGLDRLRESAAGGTAG